MNDKIRIVLVNPSHPGNIGAAARAMKNMGLRSLYLVDPQKFPHPEAIYRASRADGIVKNAVVVQTLDEAIKNCVYVFGASTRDRVMSSPVLNVREMSEKIINECADDEVAIVFGRERTGLNDAEIRRCQYQVKIPAVEDYSSLNLAAAVQVVTYELRMAMLTQDVVLAKDNKGESVDLATAGELEGLYQHLEEVMAEIGFLNTNKPRMMMSRFRKIFNHAELDKEDVNLLRGMLKRILAF
jgi:tRNA (cytidine32/uridine32-2'-O)-methyltransferase